MKKAKIKSVVLWFAFVAFLIWIGLDLIRAISCSPVPAYRISCANNLKQIGLGIKMYAADHGKAYPPGFVDAGEYLAHQPKLFICRESGNEHGPFETVDEWSDYVYMSGLTESSPEDAVLAYCDPRNHDGDGGNILFVDGHVEWFNAKSNDERWPSFKDVISKTREQERP